VPDFGGDGLGVDFVRGGRVLEDARFIGDSKLCSEGGGYGCLFSLTGIDEEGLTGRELESTDLVSLFIHPNRLTSVLDPNVGAKISFGAAGLFTARGQLDPTASGELALCSRNA